MSVLGGSGSGAWVGTLGDEALIVTNAHVLKEEGSSPPSHAELVFDTHLGVREARKARVLAVDERADLGLLAVRPPPDVQPLALGPSMSLEDGTSLYVSGFPFGVQLLRSTVRVHAGSNSSGGFVIGRRGGDLLVLCNRHAVVDRFSLPLPKLEVSAIGEDGGERKGSAELIRSGPPHGGHHSLTRHGATSNLYRAPACHRVASSTRAALAGRPGGPRDTHHHRWGGPYSTARAWAARTLPQGRTPSFSSIFTALVFLGSSLSDFL